MEKIYTIIIFEKGIPKELVSYKLNSQEDNEKISKSILRILNKNRVELVKPIEFYGKDYNL